MGGAVLVLVAAVDSLAHGPAVVNGTTAFQMEPSVDFHKPR